MGEQSKVFLRALLVIGVAALVAAFLWDTVAFGQNAESSKRATQILGASFAGVDAKPIGTESTVAKINEKKTPKQLMRYIEKYGIAYSIPEGYVDYALDTNDGQGREFALLNISNEEPIGIPEPQYGLQWRTADVFQSNYTLIEIYFGNMGGLLLEQNYTSGPVEQIPAKMEGLLVFPEGERWHNFSTYNNTTIGITTFYFENIPPFNSDSFEIMIDATYRKLRREGVSDIDNMFNAFILLQPPETATKVEVILMRRYYSNGTIAPMFNGYNFTGSTATYGWPDARTYPYDPENCSALTFGFAITINRTNISQNINKYTFGGVRMAKFSSYRWVYSQGWVDPPVCEYPLFMGYELMHTPSET